MVKEKVKADTRSTHLSRDLHTELKVRAARSGMPVRKYLEKLLKRELKKEMKQDEYKC